MGIKNIRESIIDFFNNKKYFSIDDLKKELDKKAVIFRNDTLKHYCYDLKKEEIIYTAGKGWYSNIKKQL